jgi:titin
VVTPGDSKVTLSWSAPASDGGASIEYYVVYQNGTDVQHPSGLSAEVTGLINGVNYSFAVAAHNSVGLGEQSEAINAIPVGVPGMPTDLQASPGDSQVNLSWSVPASDGGSPIDYYIVFQNGTDIAHPTDTSINVAGLKNNISYDFAVAAHNSFGDGPATPTVSATPSSQAVVPGPPTGLVVTPGDSKVTLSWQAPASGSGIDYYIIYQNGTDVQHTSALSAEVTGLSNGVTYSFAVAAHNSVGDGPATPTVSATPSAQVVVPGAPTGLVVTPGDSKVTLSWTAPSTGLSAIDYYIVYQNGTDVKHTTVTSCEIPGLRNGVQYSFTVAAHSPAGTGTPSVAQLAIPSPEEAFSIFGIDPLILLGAVGAVIVAALGAVALRSRRRKRSKQAPTAQVEPAKVEPSPQAAAAAPAPQFCPFCGAPGSGGEFCGNCGKKWR